MAATQTLISDFETAQRLVDFLEKDGFALQAAVYAMNDEGKGRLYLVPVDYATGTLDQMVQVSQTIANHRGALPGRYDLQFSVVRPDNAIVEAVTSAGSPDGHVRGVLKNGTYVDEAYVLRPAA